MLVEELLHSDYRKLKFINRFSGQFLVKNETDVDHVWEMISMALYLVPKWNESLNYKLDLQNIIYRIVVHDLDESVTSDIPRTFKYHNPAFTEAVKNTVNDIMSERFNPSIISDIKSAKDFYNEEGLVVSILDVVQVSLKYADEIMNCGNNSIKHELLGFNIEVLNKLINKLEKSKFHDLSEILIEFIKNILNDLNQL